MLMRVGMLFVSHIPLVSVTNVYADPGALLTVLSAETQDGGHIYRCDCMVAGERASFTTTLRFHASAARNDARFRMIA